MAYDFPSSPSVGQVYLGYTWDGEKWIGGGGGGNVRYDIAQGLSASQQDMARQNIVSFGVVRVQVFTANGTYTPNPNLIYAKIECVAGGGAGGGISAVGASASAAGGGGGAGAYSFAWVTAAQIGASKAVVVGGGGASAVGGNGGGGGDCAVMPLCLAKGGLGANNAPSGNNTVGGNGGLASGGIGDFKVNGGAGATGVASVTSAAYVCAGGSGGASYFGSGGQGQISSGGGYGATVPGAGGGGAAGMTGAAANGGGTGGPAICIITEFCSK